MDFAGHYERRTLPIEGVSMRAALDRIEAALEKMRAAQGFVREDVFGSGFAISGYVVERTQ